MSEVRSVAESWAIIEGKLGATTKWWSPGASAEAIHDGSGTFLGRYELSSLEARRESMFEEIVASLGPPSPDHIRAVGPVRAQRWNRKWVPVVRTGSARSLVLDLDPLPAGNVGQVVEIARELNAVPITTPSFAVWLERFADQLATDENPLF